MSEIKETVQIFLMRGGSFTWHRGLEYVDVYKKEWGVGFERDRSGGAKQFVCIPWHRIAKVVVEQTTVIQEAEADDD